MDDRTFGIILFTLGSTVFVVVLAGILKFELNPAFYTVPAGIVAFLTARASRGNTEDNGNSKPPVMSEDLLNEERQKIKDYLDRTSR